MSSQILLVESADCPGLVHAITGVLFRRGLNVVRNAEYVDRTLSRFFMRTEFDGACDESSVVEEVLGLLPAGGLVRVSALAPKRIIVLASTEHHCLADLLVRHEFGDLNAHILAVVSNHEALGAFVNKFGIPFHHVGHAAPRTGTRLTREAHEARVLDVIAPYAADYLVLAKYMRVLSPAFVAKFESRIVNIHHSFLPAFAGARPYHQAFERGVKVIGATAHFVTETLDDGPIIVQQVMPVDHTHGPRDLAQAGRDGEQLALARALRLVFEDRVFLSGRRTVIFD
ncbi:MAG: formyltetrahydrofolate deformylase [Acidobacteriota bacterium]